MWFTEAAVKLYSVHVSAMHQMYMNMDGLFPVDFMCSSRISFRFGAEDLCLFCALFSALIISQQLRILNVSNKKHEMLNEKLALQFISIRISTTMREDTNHATLSLLHLLQKTRIVLISCNFLNVSFNMFLK